MKNIFSVILTILVWIISQSCVYACSCAAGASTQDGSFSNVPIDHALDKSDAVFRGQVFDFRLIKADRDYREAIFEVSEVWKGPREKRILILTKLGGGDCGFDFMVGRQYLVFANKHEDGYGVSICGGTRQWLDSQEIYQVLKKGFEVTQQ